MFTFVLAASAYFAMVGALLRYLQQRREESPANAPVVAIIVCWAVLFWCYRRWRMREAMRVHLSGPFLFCVVPLVAVLIAGAVLVIRDLRLPTQSELGNFASNVLGFEFAAFCVSSAISSLVSLPVSVLVFLCRGLLREQPLRTVAGEKAVRH